MNLNILDVHIVEDKYNRRPTMMLHYTKDTIP